MSHGSDHRPFLIRVVVATVGVTVLAVVWSQLWSGDSRPTAASESAISLHETHATPVESDTTPTVPTTTPAALLVTAPTPTPDETLKAQFLGIWQHSKNGEQWIENREDGTARMLLKLDFISSLLYGQQTHLDLIWDVKDGVLSHTVVGGSPVVNMNKIVKDFGKSRHYTILETTRQRMLLQSLSDKQKDLWTRASAPREWAK